MFKLQTNPVLAVRLSLLAVCTLLLVALILPEHLASGRSFVTGLALGICTGTLIFSSSLLTSGQTISEQDDETMTLGLRS